MSSKSIKKNYTFNVAYQILTILMPLITAPYLSRVLQPNGIGTVSFAESIESYFSLVAVMGINSYCQREISYVQSDIEKRSEVFWSTKLLNWCTAGATMVVYLIFALMQKNNSVIYLVLSLNLVSVFFDITWFFQGMEDFAKTVTRNAIFKIINIAYIFTFVKNREDIIVYVIGIGLFSVLGNISLWAYLPKYIKKVKLSTLKPFKSIKVVLSLFIPAVATQIYSVLDKTLIGIITGSSTENGYYEQAMKISRMLLATITALGTVMMPRIGYLFQTGKKEEIQRYMYRGCRFVWFLGVPMCLGVIIIAGNFVPWFFGTGYEKVVPLLQILSLLIPIIGFSNLVGSQYLIPTKRQNKFTISVMLGAAVNFGMNTFMIYFYKSVGAAIASVAAETVVTVSMVISAKKELSAKLMLREGHNYFIAGTVMSLILLPFSMIFSPSVGCTLMMVAIGSAVYFGVLLMERDEFFTSNVLNLFRQIKNLYRRGKL